MCAAGGALRPIPYNQELLRRLHAEQEREFAELAPPHDRMQRGPDHDRMQRGPAVLLGPAARRFRRSA
jgi:hypothetical protein